MRVKSRSIHYFLHVCKSDTIFHGPAGIQDLRCWIKCRNCVNSSLNCIFSWVPQHNWSVGECVSCWRKVCVVNWQLWRLLDIQSALAFHEILVVVLSDVTLDTLFDGWGLRWVDVLGGWMLTLYWWFGYPYCDGLVQERRNTLELRLSCTCW